MCQSSNKRSCLLGRGRRRTGLAAIPRPSPFPAIRGRGIADDKANLAVHLGALRAFVGRPPVGIRVVLEGQEEYGSVLDDYPPQNP